jgi:ABC-type branched-subunit amino acid transport system ATPase component/ABC-type branched-subunit amino acid transport system permease subunit
MNAILSRLRPPDRSASRWMVPAILVILLYLVPQLGGGASFRMGEYEAILSFVIIGVALNIAMGYAGQYILGITAVFAVGAYAAALAAEHHPAGVGLVVMSLIGAIVGAAGGLVIGLPALRVGGFYLALVSLFAALAIPAVAQQLAFVGGNTGIPLYAVTGFAPKITGEVLYLVILTVVLLVTLFSWALVHSRVGRRFIALHTSEQLASSIGVTGYRTKLSAILIASVLAGGAGGIYVYTQQFFGPGSSSVNLAVLLLAGLVIGGAGTISGPLVGGVLILGLNEFLTGFQTYSDIIFGALLLAFAIFMPNGLIARIDALSTRLGIRRPPSGSSVAGRGPGETDPPEVRARVASLPAWPPVIGADGNSPLVIEGARRAFGGVTALADLDLTIERGKIHGLIGSNGSGKTTLLNLISGFYAMDAGQIRVGATRLDTRPAYVVARTGIARTFQSPKLMLRENALDNVIPAVELRVRCLGAESVLRLPRGARVNRESRSEALEVLESLGLHRIIDQPASELPHGTRRLVELARAIAMRPSFILLDEPAAGLSPAELELLFSAVENLARSGVGILLIEHNVPMVLGVADQVTVLHQGKRLFLGTPAELRSNTEVASAFLGIDNEPLEASS